MVILDACSPIHRLLAMAEFEQARFARCTGLGTMLQLENINDKVFAHLVKIRVDVLSAETEPREVKTL